MQKGRRLRAARRAPGRWRRRRSGNPRAGPSHRRVVVARATALLARAMQIYPRRPRPDRATALRVPRFALVRRQSTTPERVRSAALFPCGGPEGRIAEWLGSHKRYLKPENIGAGAGDLHLARTRPPAAHP